LRHLEVITTSKELAVRLADLARAIRDRIQNVLAIETEKGPSKLMKAFQQALIHDLSADDFADMYAQTIAYGLLSARVANPTHDTADAIATHIPVTNPFLKELMETFLHLGGRKRKERGGDGIDFDELGVSEVVELLDAANMEAVVRNFGDQNRDQDPVIHFYESFLKEYDAKKRMQRGVFYTPQPVVSYIVRSVHKLLQTEFDLEDGLASTVTWGEMAVKHAGLKIPVGVNSAGPFVQILDPATGTATFLVEVIDIIYCTLMEKWKRQRLTDAQQRAAWNEYVPKNLLPRLHGYELMMAPYAIAHMKIGLKLFETGYRFGSDERARIYLTNALEPSSDDKKQREFEQWVPALAHEAKAVNAIKRHQRFTVVIGNPPYNNRSENKTPWIMGLIEIYKSKVRQEETQIQALSDDYVKFLRFADWNVSQSGVGAVGMITNNGYLDGHIFRDLRDHIVRFYSSVRVLNLHGDSRKKERAPDGTIDKNVFDIMQGVSILVLGRDPTHDAPASVSYADLWGDREPSANSYGMTYRSTTGLKSPPRPPRRCFSQCAAPWTTGTPRSRWPNVSVPETGPQTKQAPTVPVSSHSRMNSPWRSRRRN
jgi:predicted helicase